MYVYMYINQYHNVYRLLLLICHVQLTDETYRVLLYYKYILLIYIIG